MAFFACNGAAIMDRMPLPSKGPPALDAPGSFGLARAEEFDSMVAHASDSRPLVERVASRVRELTYGRIRNLDVEEVQGQVIVRGNVPSHHVRQLALKGVLELIPGDRCRPDIRVG
jgi:hypothetical protein